MLDLVMSLLWVGGGLLLVYPVAHVVAHALPLREDERPEGADWVLGGIVGVFVGAFWPLAVTALGAFMLSRRIWVGTWRLPWRWPARAEQTREAS